MSHDHASPMDATTCDPLDLIEQLGDDLELRKWPARLHDLYTLHREFNERRRGMTPDAAALDARDRCILLANYLGGRAYNIPRGDALRIALRDKQIHEEFNGKNHEELADRYGLNIITVYRIIRQQIKLSRESRMRGRLFDRASDNAEARA